MRKISYSRNFRHLFPAWCLMLSALILTGCSIPEGGFAWKLWGFEIHTFTVAGEEIGMRLDNSGFGRYEVTLLEEEGVIRVSRDGNAILEGYFISAEECMDWMTAVLADPDCEVVESSPEDAPTSLLCHYETADEAGYILLSLIDGSELGTVFNVLGGDTDEAALDYAHRLQFTRKN